MNWRVNLVNKIKTFINDVRRSGLRKEMNGRLKDDRFVLIGSNCVVGTLLHDLMLPFNTPTINMTIPSFVSFCENLNENLSSEVIFSHFIENKGGWISCIYSQRNRIARCTL